MHRLLTLVALASLAAALGACGKHKAPTTVQALPPANPVAVSKLAQGVEASKDKSGKKAAIDLLEEAVRADGQLWEGRYNLGVLLAESGDLTGAEKQLDAAYKLAPNAEDVVVAQRGVEGELGAA